MRDYEEILDLVAEAARTSKHAERAFELMTQNQKGRGDRTLKLRQMLIEGRMKEAC